MGHYLRERVRRTERCRGSGTPERPDIVVAGRTDKGTFLHFIRESVHKTTVRRARLIVKIITKNAPIAALVIITTKTVERGRDSLFQPQRNGVLAGTAPHQGRAKETGIAPDKSQRPTAGSRFSEGGLRMNFLARIFRWRTGGLQRGVGERERDGGRERVLLVPLGTTGRRGQLDRARHQLVSHDRRVRCGTLLVASRVFFASCVLVPK